MLADARQLEMLGHQASTYSADVEEEMARSCKSRQHALRKCFEASNLEHKQVYCALGIDQGQFSRILGGSAHLDPNLLHDFMRVCGNLIPLRYDAFKLGFELKPVRTGLEERVAALEEENRDLRRAAQLVAELLRGGR